MEIHLERTLDLPAADVWAVLGEGFGELGWATGITRSTLDGDLKVGCVRTCHVPDGALSKAGAVSERLVDFDRDAMRLAYEITKPVGVLREAINRWSVTPLGPGRCRVRSHATLTLGGWAVLLSPLMRLMIRRMGNRFVTELAAQTRHRAGTIESPALASA